MSVDRDEVRRIAELAKLRLEEEEADRLTGEMNRILEHAERLRGLPAPDAGGAGATTPGRDEDEHAGDASHDPEAGSPGGAAHGGAGQGAEPPDALLRPLGELAPSMDEGFFTVPPPPGVTAGETHGEGDQTATDDPPDDARASGS